MGFHAEEHDVGGPDRVEAVGHRGLRLEVALRAGNTHATLSHGAQVRAAGEERDVLAGARHAGPQVGPDRARAGDHRPHPVALASDAATARRWIFPVAVRGSEGTM